MAVLNLPIARHFLILRAQTPIQFPAYAGSTWRGVFGRALRRTVCVTREPTCTACLLARTCVYRQVFETPAQQEPLLEKIDIAPHPYILRPLATSGKRYAPEDVFTLGLTLIGTATDYAPYIIHALQQAGERGIGKGDGRYALESVEAQALPPMPALPKRVTVRLLTPLRLLQNGTPVRAGRFTFARFIMTVIRRISLLHAYHTGKALGVDFKALSQQAAGVALLEAQLYWHEWSRYSNRQQAKVPMDGLLGRFEVAGEALTPFWEWLWWGQWVHAGKGAVMGMGEYVLACYTGENTA